MATDWETGHIEDRQADLARAVPVKGGVQLEFAARVRLENGGVRAQPVLSVGMSREAARALLRLLSTLIADSEPPRN